MPITIAFSHDLPYIVAGTSLESSPALQISISAVTDPESAIFITAHLDSGAEITCIDGKLAPAIGLTLLSGPIQRFNMTNGGELIAHKHMIRLSHAALGDCDMQVAFSIGPMRRNLLGLDFFNHFKICFHERHQHLLFERE